MPVEQVQDLVGILLYAAWQPVPVAAIDYTFECRDLKLIFHVDGHGIDDMGRRAFCF